MSDRTGRTLAATLSILIFLTIAVTVRAAETRLVKPAFDGGEVILVFAEAPLVTMTEIPFHIEVIGATGIKISDAKLHLGLDMPAMPMPPNHPKVTFRDGAYRGMAVFTMAGAWQVFVNIQRPGYEPAQVVFDIERVMMK